MLTSVGLAPPQPPLMTHTSTYSTQTCQSQAHDTSGHRQWGMVKFYRAELLSWCYIIWRSGTRRWNLRVPNLPMSCRDFAASQGTRILSPAMAAQWHALLLCRYVTELVGPRPSIMALIVPMPNGTLKFSRTWPNNIQGGWWLMYWS